MQVHPEISPRALEEGKCEECCICHDALVYADKKAYPCHSAHIVHKKCFDQWPNSCPVCRAPVTKENKRNVFFTPMPSSPSTEIVVYQPVEHWNRTFVFLSLLLLGNLVGATPIAFVILDFMFGITDVLILCVVVYMALHIGLYGVICRCLKIQERRAGHDGRDRYYSACSSLYILSVIDGFIVSAISVCVSFQSFSFVLIPVFVFVLSVIIYVPIYSNAVIGCGYGWLWFLGCCFSSEQVNADGANRVCSLLGRSCALVFLFACIGGVITFFVFFYGGYF